MPPRMPSQSQLRSQMNSAMRRAESQFKSEVRKAERKLQTDVQRDLAKWERDTNRKLASAARPSVTYTVQERRTLEPVETQAARIAVEHPDRRDVFLCHAWDDRETAAAELHDHLVDFGVDVWFSEKDVVLGTSLHREIDRGLRMSRVGVVLVTPNMLRSLAGRGVADKELAALLATERVIPDVHETNFQALVDESPLLASRAGLNTTGSSLREVAVKIADTVRPLGDDE